MQTQDASAEILFKLWPWLEANKNRLIGAVVCIIVVAGIWFYISTQREEREADAGRAMSSLMGNPPANATASQIAVSLEQLAVTYAGTATAQRALLEAAGILYESGNYAEAQMQFQKCLAGEPAGPFAATAQLGVASCLESLNKLDEAATQYQKVLTLFPGSPFVPQAQFGLARIDELQNRFSEAIANYDKVSANAVGRGGTLSQEAGLRSEVLKAKMMAAAAAAPAGSTKPTFTPMPQAAPQAAPAPAAAVPAKP